MIRKLIFSAGLLFSSLLLIPLSSTQVVMIQDDLDIKIHECRSLVSLYSNQNADVLKMFDETIVLWKIYQKTDRDFDIHTLLKAVSFAAIKHQGQTRKDLHCTPYIIHPIGVSRILWEEGKIRSANVLVAALLHDTLEDTETTPTELEHLFGPRVYSTVTEVTNDPLLTSLENKQRQVDHGPFLSMDAKLVKLADRIYNIRDMKNSDWNEEKIQNYKSWGSKLLKALNGTNKRLERTLQIEIKSKESEKISI
jgi:(p)ppGpp synthase/HD superfamily hydrolase